MIRLHAPVRLSTPDTTARVALACAGLSGNRHLGRTLQNTPAEEVVAACMDGTNHGLPDAVAFRVRTLVNPALVAAVLTSTARDGLTLLTPADPRWPQSLQRLGAAAPVVLWVAGDPDLLREEPVVITGGTRPDAQLRHQVIEVTTATAQSGRLVAAAARHGVDDLVGRATLALEGRLLTVATTPRLLDPGPGQVVVSENPPYLPAVMASQVRTPVLLAALAEKVLVADARPGTGAYRTAVAAHALERPLGVLGDPAHGVRGKRVSTLVEVERLV
ncbi:DNA-processing protein DprA [Schumannella sp. 10F1B-5-1]|uniref:DNA-processing protein DprA n=1 Tax=Schumannella sp. 10F1B-5-1 TaxID=2590780 RepID=UPI00113008D1|nr:DNA-processing protein DprA [Schumannella sp. 10F1B-5-1]TPW78406.1 hypothetical protein FJ658_00950 [Schumannella sp. 10F1B-5-1]